MGRPLDEMTFVVTRHPGAWTDGPWVPTERTLAAPIDGTPTPKSQATVTPDTSIFTVGDYAEFYTSADVPIGYAEITGLPGAGVINFVTNSLTWDVAAGTRVRPVYELKASKPTLTMISRLCTWSSGTAQVSPLIPSTTRERTTRCRPIPSGSTCPWVTMPTSSWSMALMRSTHERLGR
jgi:hypothetical protein